MSAFTATAPDRVLDLGDLLRELVAHGRVDQDVAEQILINCASWVAPQGLPNPRTLVLRDDNHGEERYDELRAHRLENVDG